MATIEEERARVRGLQLPTAEQAGQGIRNFVPEALNRANTFVRNTSPVREIYGAADMVGRFAKGLFNRSESMAAEASQPASLEQLAQPQQAPSVTDPPTAPPVQTPSPSITPQATEQPAPQQSAGMRFRGADQERVDTLGLREALTPPSANIGLTPMRGEDGTYVIRESINGGPGGPALRDPFVSAKRFRQLTGFDKNDNPIYSTGVDEMNAANAGITSYNTALQDKYQQRDDAFEQRFGGIPRDQAQADYYGAQAVEEPANSESLRGLRTSQTKINNVQADMGNYGTLTEEIPYGDPMLGQTTKREIPYNKKTGEIMSNTGGGGTTAPAEYEGLQDDRKSVVDKYFGDRFTKTGQKASATEIREFIENRWGK